MNTLTNPIMAGYLIISMDSSLFSNYWHIEKNAYLLYTINKERICFFLYDFKDNFKFM